MQAPEVRAHRSPDCQDNTGTFIQEHAVRASEAPPVHVARMSRLLRYAAVDWLVICGIWTILLRSSAWAYPIGWLILAGRFHSLGVVLHDAAHMGKRAHGVQSGLLQLIAAYPIATTLRAMRYHHLRHHRYSGTPLDPYLRPGISYSLRQRNMRRLTGLLLVPFWIVRGFFGTAASLVPAWRNVYGHVFLQDRSSRDLAHSLEVRACLRAEPAQCAFFALVISIAVAYPGPVLMLYLIPLILAGAINVNRVIVEHEHVLCADRRPETVVTHTLTHAGGWVSRAVLFPRNIGFHVVHHLFPQAGLETLPDLHRWYITHWRAG